MENEAYLQLTTQHEKLKEKVEELQTEIISLEHTIESLEDELEEYKAEELQLKEVFLNVYEEICTGKLIANETIRELVWHFAGEDSMSNDAEQMAAIFSGHENIFGRFKTGNGVREDGKVEGIAKTWRGKPNWVAHLEGREGLGIVPLREDCSVTFAAIDIDVYQDFDIYALEQEIQDKKLPLVVCKSKSGGAHLYLFLKHPIPAVKVVPVLKEWRAFLRYPKAEVFPKQTYRRDNLDMGNWLNMPYFNRTERVAVHCGADVTLPEFFMLVKQKAVGEEVLDAFAKQNSQTTSLYKKAPPCFARALQNGGFGKGERNEAMYNVCVYCVKNYGDDWKNKVSEMNAVLCSPPLSFNELGTLMSSVEKHKEEYHYKCSGQYCDKAKCKRSTGAQKTSEVNIDVESVTKVEGDKAFWYLQINSRRLRLTTEQLLLQSAFNVRLAESLNIITPPVKTDIWAGFVQSVLDRADITQIPVDATWAGLFMQVFSRFCGGEIGMLAATKEEIIYRKVFQDTDNSVLFLPLTLFEFLNESKFKFDSQEQVWAILKDHEVEEREITIKNGMKYNAWRVPNIVAIIELNKDDHEQKEIF